MPYFFHREKNAPSAITDFSEYKEKIGDHTMISLTYFAIFVGLTAGLGIIPLDAAMKIESSAFKEGEAIPAKYTCNGVNVSPPLNILGKPKNATTFAIIVDDHDAKGGSFAHWVAWNIPGDTQNFPEDSSFSHQGKNNFGEKKYQGPCPPPGQLHHYYFSIYALDTELNLPDETTEVQLLEAMDGHLLDRAELMGTFQR
jgi:hypothetical protein